MEVGKKLFEFKDSNLDTHDSEFETFTNLMKEKNPDLKWEAEVRNFG